MKNIFTKTFALTLMLLLGINSVWGDNYLPGSWNNWQTDNESAKFANGRLTLSLSANTTYQFKIYDTYNNGKWFHNNGTMVAGNCKGWNFDEDKDGEGNPNCRLTTTTAGDYEFTINWNGSKPQISVFYPNETVKMYSSSGNAYAGADGNSGTRWESAKTDNEWWMIDYGTAKEFNTIKINWEGAYSKQFTLEGSNNGTDWDVLYTETNQTSAGIHTYDIGNTVNYRYVKINITKRATEYGNSFFEFETYVVQADIITSLDFKAASAFAKVGGTAVTLTTTVKNQYDLPMQADVTYTVSPAEAGHVIDGAYHADAFGNATITAQAGTVSKTVTIFNHVNDNIALNKTVTAEEGTRGEASCLVDGKNNSGDKWDCSNTADKPWDGNDKNHQSWALIDLGDRYDIELVNIYFDGACSHGYGIWYSLDGENFTEAYTYARNCGENHSHKDFLFPGVVKTGVTDHQIAQTNIRYIKYINTEMGNYGARLYEIEVYGSLNQSSIVNVTGVALNKGTTTIVEGQTETLVATIAPADATNKAVTWTSSASNIASVDANGIVTAVYPGEATITVTTAEGNFTANCVVTVTSDPTKPHEAAPVPTRVAENVISLYSDAYNCINVSSWHSWGALPVVENTVLGDKYLYYSITKTDCDNGIEFAQQDLTDYEYMHIDVWSEVAGTLTFTLKNPTLAKVTLEAKKWNSFDLPLSAANLSAADIASVYFIKINQASAELKDHNIAVDNIYFWKKTSHDLAVSAAGYASLYLPFAAKIPDDVEVFTGKYDANESTLTLETLSQQTVIPARTAVVVKAAEKTYTFDEEVSAPEIERNDLLGVLEETDASTLVDANHVALTLGKKDGKVGFYQPAGGIIGANKIYLVVNKPADPGQTPAPVRIVMPSDVATSTENILSGEAAQKLLINGQLHIVRDGKTFDITGRIIK